MKKRRVLSKDENRDPKFKKELDLCLRSCSVRPQLFALNPDTPLKPAKLHEWTSSFIAETEFTVLKLYNRHESSPFDMLARMIQLKLMSLTSEDHLEDG